MISSRGGIKTAFAWITIPFSKVTKKKYLIA
nr:MAG TPA: hypothetical protein [Caudoviricetes sp.]